MRCIQSHRLSLENVDTVVEVRIDVNHQSSTCFQYKLVKYCVREEGCCDGQRPFGDFSWSINLILPWMQSTNKAPLETLCWYPGNFLHRNLPAQASLDI